jgi:hypothetical protein
MLLQLYVQLYGQRPLRTKLSAAAGVKAHHGLIVFYSAPVNCAPVVGFSALIVWRSQQLPNSCFADFGNFVKLCTF